MVGMVYHSLKSSALESAMKGTDNISFIKPLKPPSLFLLPSLPHLHLSPRQGLAM